MDAADDYLQMSGIQHFCFCRRQWALIHLEQQWAENLRTTEGRLEHSRCHDATQTEQRRAGDPYVGFLHRARPGRRSLAFDLMEELRSVYADRFVLSCINQKILTGKHFQKQENGAVLLTDEGRKTFLCSWQAKKQEQITHPFLKEKIAWGLVPYVQALLLARTLRGDLELYPPFFWK